MRFLVEKIIDREIKFNKKRKQTKTKTDAHENDEIDVYTLKFQNIRDYKTIFINLYHYQKFRHLNQHSKLNEVVFSTLMKIQRNMQHHRSKKQHENRDKEIVTDDYNLQKLKRITNSF